MNLFWCVSGVLASTAHLQQSNPPDPPDPTSKKVVEVSAGTIWGNATWRDNSRFETARNAMKTEQDIQYAHEAMKAFQKYGALEAKNPAAQEDVSFWMQYFQKKIEQAKRKEKL